MSTFSRRGARLDLSGLNTPRKGGRPLYYTVDGKQMLNYLPPRTGAFAFTAPNTYDFDLQPGEMGRGTEAFDTPGVKHRSELSQNAVAAYDFGDTVWMATDLMLRGDLSAYDLPAGQNFLCQFHGVDTYRAPPFSVDLTDNRLHIRTYSDDYAGYITHYSGFQPLVNVAETIVAKIKFALAGSLEVWRSGDKIVEYSGPVGFYSDITNFPGRKAAYFQFGIYAHDTHAYTITDRHVNPQWGLTDLSSRVANPSGYGPNLLPALNTWTDASTAPSTISVSGVTITHNTNGSANARARASFTTEIGATYRVRRDMRSIIAGVAFGTTAGASDVAGFSNAGEFTFVATSTTTWINTATSVNGSRLTAPSVRKVL